MSYTAQIIPGGGLHPQLHISATAPPSPCALYAHLDLPPSFIPDRFQLAQLHSEGRLGAYDAIEGSSLQVAGSRDLEGPLNRAEGSEVLLRLSEGETDVQGRQREAETTQVDIPLHLRYQKPVRERWIGGQRADMVEVELPWPRVFWSCEGSQVPLSSSTPCPPSALPSSFNLTFHSLHFLAPPSSSDSTSSCPPALPPPLTLIAPTGVISDLPLVETVNFAVIWLGMLTIAWWAFKARKASKIASMAEGKGDKAL